MTTITAKMKSYHLTYVWIPWKQTAKSKRETLQRQENISPRGAVNAPRYVRNRVIFRDLEQNTVSEMMKIKVRKTFAKLGSNPNRHVRELLSNDTRFANRNKKPKSSKMKTEVFCQKKIIKKTRKRVQRRRKKRHPNVNLDDNPQKPTENN